MRKIKLVMAVAAFLGLVSSPAVYADGFSPGEGLYIGAFVGGGSGIVQPKVKTNGQIFGTTVSGIGGMKGIHEGGTFEATDGGIGLQGMEGGTWVGYGYKMGDMYAGLEGEFAWSDMKFKLTSSVAVELSAPDGTLKTITAVEAEKKWTGGMFGRLGFYVNPNTLLAFRGGVLVSEFDVTTTGSTNYSETFYGGGPSFGASLESQLTGIDPNLSIRMDTVYTDFLTASVFGIGTNTATNITNQSGHNSEVTGSTLSARVGLQYSFFDINSLF